MGLRFFFILYLLFTNAISFSQEKPLISGDFRGVTIDEFVKQIEAKTSFHFYYDPAQFGLLVINAAPKDKTLEEVLTEVFNNSEYTFSIDGQKVFFAKRADYKNNAPWFYHQPAKRFGLLEGSSRQY